MLKLYFNHHAQITITFGSQLKNTIHFHHINFPIACKLGDLAGNSSFFNGENKILKYEIHKVLEKNLKSNWENTSVTLKFPTLNGKLRDSTTDTRLFTPTPSQIHRQFLAQLYTVHVLMEASQQQKNMENEIKPLLCHP